MSSRRGRWERRGTLRVLSGSAREIINSGGFGKDALQPAAGVDFAEQDIGNGVPPSIPGYQAIRMAWTFFASLASRKDVEQFANQSLCPTAFAPAPAPVSFSFASKVDPLIALHFAIICFIFATKKLEVQI